MPRPIFENSGNPLSDADIGVAEVELGVTFPDQYRRFLLQTNGGQPNPDVVGDVPVNNFCSIGKSGVADLVYYVKMNWELGIPDDLLAIGYGMCPHTICLGIQGERLGKIFIYDEEFETLSLFAENLDSFLESFRQADLNDLDEEEDDDDDDVDDSPET